MAAKKTTGVPAAPTTGRGVPIYVTLDGSRGPAKMHVERVPCVGELLRWYGTASGSAEATRLYLEVTAVLHVPREAPLEDPEAVALVWTKRSEDPRLASRK